MTVETLSSLSDTLVYAATALYAIAFLAYAGTAVRGNAARVEPVMTTTAGASTPPAAVATTEARGIPDSSRRFLARFGLTMASMGCVAHIAAVTARAFAAERAPWGNLYEFLLVTTMTAAIAFLIYLRADPAVEVFAVWVLALILSGLGLAIAPFYTPVSGLIPVLESYWLIIHVAAAMIAGGVFVVGAVASGLYLLKSRQESCGVRTTGYIARLPSSGRLDGIAHTTALFALPVWTFTVIAGAIWAENAWGRYWGWDPKETWAFITWVFYAAYLHAQSTAGWRGTKAAWLNLAGFAAFLFNFFGVNLWITGLHSYAGV